MKIILFILLGLLLIVINVWGVSSFQLSIILRYYLDSKVCDIEERESISQFKDILLYARLMIVLADIATFCFFVGDFWLFGLCSTIILAIYYATKKLYLSNHS